MAETRDLTNIRFLRADPNGLWRSVTNLEDKAQADQTQRPRSLAEVPTYDIVECVQVLQTLPDPARAVARVLDFVVPGGFALIATSTHRDRQPVLDLAFDEAFPDDVTALNSVRDFRAKLRDAKDDALAERLRRRGEFWRLRTFTQLVLPDTEHPLDLEAIAAAVAKTGARFLGFQLPDHKRKAFADFARAKGLGRDPAIDIEAWRACEAETPDLFGGTYQFWLQRRPATGSGETSAPK